MIAVMLVHSCAVARRTCTSNLASNTHCLYVNPALDTTQTLLWLIAAAPAIVCMTPHICYSTGGVLALAIHNKSLLVDSFSCGQVCSGQTDVAHTMSIECGFRSNEKRVPSGNATVVCDLF